MKKLILLCLFGIMMAGRVGATAVPDNKVCYGDTCFNCIEESAYQNIQNMVTFRVNNIAFADKEEAKNALDRCRKFIDSYKSSTTNCYGTYNNCGTPVDPIIEQPANDEEAQIDIKFNEEYLKTIDDFPGEYINKIDAQYIKALSLKPENKHKTLRKIIIEKYGETEPVISVSSPVKMTRDQILAQIKSIYALIAQLQAQLAEMGK